MNKKSVSLLLMVIVLASVGAYFVYQNDVVDSEIILENYVLTKKEVYRNGEERNRIYDFSEIIGPRDHYDRDIDLIEVDNLALVRVFGEVVVIDKKGDTFMSLDVPSERGVEGFAFDESRNLLAVSDLYAVWFFDVSDIDKPKLLSKYKPSIQRIGNLDREHLYFDNNDLIGGSIGYGLMFERINTDDPENPYFENSWDEGMNETPVKSITSDSEFDYRYQTFHGNSPYALVHFYGHDSVSLIKRFDDRFEVIEEDLFSLLDLDLIKEVYDSVIWTYEPVSFESFAETFELNPMVFPRDAHILIFQATSNSFFQANGEDLFDDADLYISYDIKNRLFEIMDISKYAYPGYDNMKSKDGRYFVSPGKKENSNLNIGLFQDLWVHDLIEDSSVRILKLDGNKTISGNSWVNGRAGPCMPEWFWPEWVDEDSFKYNIYLAEDNYQCMNENEHIETWQYDIDTGERALVF